MTDYEIQLRFYVASLLLFNCYITAYETLTTEFEFFT